MAQTPSRPKPKSPAVRNASQVQTPSKSQKLVYVADKLKIPGLADMQGSTTNLYDTVLLASNTNPQVVDFFSNTANKSLNFTNFINGSLKAGEAIVLEEVAIFLVNLTASSLVDATGILDIKPISEIAGTSIVSNAGSLKVGSIQIDIANQTVVKQFNLFEMNPEFNPRTGGVSTPVQSTSLAPFTTFGTAGQNKVPLEAPPVLPPNQTLSVKWRIPPIGTLSGTWAAMCVVGRFGSIYASKTTL